MFLISCVYAFLMIAQLTDRLDLGETIIYVYEGLNLVHKMATCLLVVGVWLSFRDLRDRVDMLTDIVEGQGGETPAGNFGRGY